MNVLFTKKKGKNKDIKRSDRRTHYLGKESRIARRMQDGRPEEK